MQRSETADLVKQLRADCGEAGHDEGKCGNAACLGAYTAVGVPVERIVRPGLYTYTVNATWHGHCEQEPPEDAYDAGTLREWYSKKALEAAVAAERERCLADCEAVGDLGAVLVAQRIRDRAVQLTPAVAQPLTDGQILDCVRSVGVPAPMGLTRDRGPYEITEPSWFLTQLVHAIERAHGIR